MINNVIWALVAGFIQVPLAMVMAIILSRKPKGWKFFRTVYFFPQVISGIALATLWRAIYSADTGLLNGLLRAIGQGQLAKDWLGTVDTAFPAVLIYWVFYVGYYMVIMMADITTIDTSYYEAATIDGATDFQQAIYITIPLIKKTSLLTCVTLASVMGLRQFEQVYMLTNGGPANTTSTIVLYMYKKLQDANYGMASASAVILIIVGVIFIVCIRKLFEGPQRADADAQKSKEGCEMTESRVHHKLSGKEIVVAILRWILIIFFAVYTLFPLIWLVISSLKTNFEFLAGSPFALPAVPQWQNYVNALSVAGLGRMLLNSVIVGLAATAVNVIIASMGAYCISRFRFRGRERIFTLFTAGILVPLNALMVPYFVIINKLGLYNTYGGMILLYCAIGIPMSTFLIRGLMDSIPMELEEAAYIDGCGFFGRFFHIILPLSRTGIVTAATFEFLTCWNEFVFANLIVSSEKLRTIQVGIRYFTNQFSTDYVSMYAAIVISIVPSILGYILFQEQIIAGMTSGAVKG